MCVAPWYVYDGDITVFDLSPGGPRAELDCSKTEVSGRAGLAGREVVVTPRFITSVCKANIASHHHYHHHHHHHNTLMITTNTTSQVRVRQCPPFKI